MNLENLSFNAARQSTLLQTLSAHADAKRWSLIFSNQNSKLGKGDLVHLRNPNKVIQVTDRQAKDSFFAIYKALVSGNFSCIVVNGLNLDVAEQLLLGDKAKRIGTHIYFNQCSHTHIAVSH